MKKLFMFILIPYVFISAQVSFKLTDNNSLSKKLFNEFSECFRKAFTSNVYNYPFDSLKFEIEYQDSKPKTFFVVIYSDTIPMLAYSLYDNETFNLDPGVLYGMYYKIYENLYYSEIPAKLRFDIDDLFENSVVIFIKPGKLKTALYLDLFVYCDFATPPKFKLYNMAFGQKNNLRHIDFESAFTGNLLCAFYDKELYKFIKD